MYNGMNAKTRTNTLKLRKKSLIRKIKLQWRCAYAHERQHCVWY